MLGGSRSRMPEFSKEIEVGINECVYLLLLTEILTEILRVKTETQNTEDGKWPLR